MYEWGRGGWGGEFLNALTTDSFNTEMPGLKCALCKGNGSF